MKKIKLKIFPDGNLRLLNIEGAGEECDQIEKAIAPHLGPADESTRSHTAEYYETTEQGQDQEQSQG